MKYIDKPYIKKTYESNRHELITIYLEDTRDNYIEEFTLGKVGYISIGKGYLSLVAEYDDETKIREKEIALTEAFKEIFRTTEIDLKSNILYETIKGMIADGTLETLGYEKQEQPEEEYDIDVLEGYKTRIR